jgi:hypothetical protein
MRRAWFVMTCALLPLAAHADTFSSLVGYRCDARANELVITYRGAWNEAGEALRATKTRTEQDPTALITVVDDDHYGPSKVVEARCDLGRTGYRIRVGANPQGGSMDRQCGMEIGGWVEVSAGEGAAAFHHDFVRACDFKDRVVTRFVFRPGASEPVATSVDAAEFFK